MSPEPALIYQLQGVLLKFTKLETILHLSKGDKNLWFPNDVLKFVTLNYISNFAEVLLGLSESTKNIPENFNG